VREFLSDHDVPFEDRNIRASDAAREQLAALTNDLVVPQLFWGDRHVVGFDPEALTELVDAYRKHSA
jgi:glutaredoxin